MDDLVNAIESINQRIQGSGLKVRAEGDDFIIAGLHGNVRLRMTRLYRPSSEDVRRTAAPDALMILSAPTRKAATAAIEYNHIAIPQGQYRIVAPGLALIHLAATETEQTPRQVRLSGRTGAVAESLLLNPSRSWSVRELALRSQVSAPLAHRVAVRLEREGILESSGQGPDKTRRLTNVRALAELWSQEEKVPHPVLRGYVYAPSVKALAERVTSALTGSAIGGTLAANSYRPVLTRVNPPIRIWIPTAIGRGSVMETGVQWTDSGANLEFCQVKGDPWSVHASDDRVPSVSRWRAWMEIAHVEGRAQELADSLLSELEHGQHGRS